MSRLRCSHSRPCNSARREERGVEVTSKGTPIPSGDAVQPFIYVPPDLLPLLEEGLHLVCASKFEFLCVPGVLINTEKVERYLEHDPKMEKSA